MGIEYFEMMGDWMEEVAAELQAIEEAEEWEDFEADMATNPYDDPDFAW